MIIPKNKKLDEESYVREEKTVFHGSNPEKLKIIQTLICFANYQGGELRIYEVKNKADLKTFFDAASIGDAINSFIEPPIGGVIAVKQINKKKGVSLKIRPSTRSPHFYKKDGCFINSKNEKIFIFQRGSVGIRRSGSNDVYSSVDFEQMFKKKIAEIFGSIQDIVVKQPMGKLMDTLQNIKKISTGSVPYVYNPSDPLAIPIKQIIDTEPFVSLEEELNAAVKSWKTSGTLVNENLISKAYLEPTKIKNQEWIKLLFLSSLEKRMPLCLWSTKLKRNELNKLIMDIVKKDLYPSAKEIVSLVPFLSLKKAKKILNLSINSKYISVRNFTPKILKDINLNYQQKIDNLKRKFGTGNTYKIGLQNEEFEIDIKNLNKDDLKRLVSVFISASKEDKTKLKYILRVLDPIMYGRQLVK